MGIIKKFAVLFAAAAVTAFSFTSFSVSAEDELSYNQLEEDNHTSDDIKTSGDYEYYVKDGASGEQTAVLESYTGSDTDVVIPETIDGYVVEALGEGTFIEKTQIKSITIPSGLKNFGTYPFYGCTSITEYKVSEKNEVYKADSDGVLMGKHGLSIVSYPAGKKPESYTVPNGVVRIEASAFAMCNDLKEIIFPDSLEKIGRFSFSECTSLETVKLPDSVKELDIGAFHSCTALKNIEFSNNLETIGGSAFSLCTSLEEISFPASLREIGQAAFCGTAMVSVTVPSTVNTIGYSAFGFTIDQTNQIVPSNNFVLRGYNSTTAQLYCSENSIEFASLGDVKDDPALKSNKEEKESALGKIIKRFVNWVRKLYKKTPPGTIVAICIASVAVIAVIVIMIVRTLKKNKNDNDEESEDEDDGNDEEDDNTEDNE